MMTGTPESVTFVPISRIEVLNSRDRNMKVFEEIVDNIRNALASKNPSPSPSAQAQMASPVTTWSVGKGA
jgi:ParB family chromosome partitioning protein